MFDFRYHAITLVAVLVALVIGLLLGVAVGDQGLVSGAEQDLRRNLRSDVEAARASSRDLRAELALRDRYEELTYPALVAGRLSGRRVAVLTLHQPPSASFDAIRDALAPSGGELAFSGRLRLPPDVGALTEAVPRRFAALATDMDALDRFAERAGEQLVTGGRLVGDLRKQLFAASSGTLDGAEAIILIRGEPASERPADAVEQEERFVSALIRGLESFETPVVGVERTDTDPSQVPWYRDHGIASVDDIDRPAGRAALVLVLAGGGAGAYGIKPTADGLLPEALLQAP